MHDKNSPRRTVNSQRSFASTVYYSATRAIKRHATGGNILIAATVLAMAAANIPGIDSH